MIPIFLVAVIVAVAQGGANLSSLQVSRTPNQVDVGPQNSGSRIMGGEPCSDCQWMASLKHYQYHSPDSSISLLMLVTTHVCSGTIIRPLWIVSAANCFNSTTNPEGVEIRVGSSNPSSGGKLYRAKKIIIHERYRLRENNIALIRLSEQITFNKEIKPLSLIKKPLSVGSIVSASWWAKTQIGFIYADHYRHAKLGIVECKWHLGSLENVICAYKPGKSICTDDYGRGGPLYDAKTLQLVSVISSIEYSNCTGFVFGSDVFRLSDWIEDHINRIDNPPNTGSSYRPLLVCWLVTLLHLLHLFYICRFC